MMKKGNRAFLTSLSSLLLILLFTGCTHTKVTKNEGEQGEKIKVVKKTTVCGDGITDSKEKCDDGKGNTDTAPCKDDYEKECEYCSSKCMKMTGKGPYCGDGMKNGPEQCDDGNTDDKDHCTSECKKMPCIALQQLEDSIGVCNENAQYCHAFDCEDGDSRIITTQKITNLPFLDIKANGYLDGDTCYSRGKMIATLVMADESKLSKSIELPCYEPGDVELQFQRQGNKLLTGELTIKITRGDWCSVINNLEIRECEEISK